MQRLEKRCCEKFTCQKVNWLQRNEIRGKKGAEEIGKWKCRNLTNYSLVYIYSDILCFLFFFNSIEALVVKVNIETE